MDALFSYSVGSHSAQNSSISCFLPQYSLYLSNSTKCHSSSMSCFEYRTNNNTSIYFSGVDCLLLESCDNATNQCASNTSICIINSCCSTRAICMPLLFADFCTTNEHDPSNYFANVIWSESCNQENLTGYGFMERFAVNAGSNYAGGCGSVIHRAALFFHEIDRIPSVVVTVRSAKLFLYGVIYNTSDPQNWMDFDWRQPNDLWIEQCTSPWTRNTASWVNQPNTTTINAATIPGTNAQIIYNPVIDVTDLVNDMRLPGQSNYGFMLKCKTEIRYRGMAFYAFGCPEIDRRPRLELIY